MPHTQYFYHVVLFFEYVALYCYSQFYRCSFCDQISSTDVSVWSSICACGARGYKKNKSSEIDNDILLVEEYEEGGEAKEKNNKTGKKEISRNNEMTEKAGDGGTRKAAKVPVTRKIKKQINNRSLSKTQ